MFSIGAKINNSLSVTQHRWTPFIALAASEFGRMISGDVDGPEVTAVDVATIGVEEHGLAIGSEGPLLDFAVAGSEQVRGPAFRRKRVEMLPSIFFGSDE